MFPVPTITYLSVQNLYFKEVIEKSVMYENPYMTHAVYSSLNE